MTDALPTELAAWRSQGEEVRVRAHRLYARSIGDRAAGPTRTLLIVHGVHESSVSFRHVAPALAAHFERVVLVDLLGFGLSDKPQAWSYSLFEQADVLLEAWRALGVRGGHVLGHDMGDSIVSELVARRERGLLPGWLDGDLQSLTFTDGNMVMERARLRLGQRLLRTPYLGALFGRAGSFTVFRQQVRSASGTAMPDRDIELMWAALRYGGGQRVQHRIIGYLDERDRFQNERWLPALATTSLPIHLCWGALDRVWQRAAQRELCRDRGRKRAPGAVCVARFDPRRRELGHGNHDGDALGRRVAEHQAALQEGDRCRSRPAGRRLDLRDHRRPGEERRDRGGARR